MEQEQAFVDDMGLPVLDRLADLRGVMSKRGHHSEDATFLDREEAADFIGMSTFWLEKHSDNPRAPRFIKNGRKVWYRRSDLEDWKAAREQALGGPLPKKRKRVRLTETPDFKELDKQYEREWGAVREARNRAVHGTDRSPLKKLAKVKAFLETLSPIQKQQFEELLEDE